MSAPPGLSARRRLGAEAVDLYQQSAELSLSSTVTYATPAPADSVILSGTFLDANTSAALTATINWGDGSAPTVLNLPAGSYAFSAPHDYMTYPDSSYYGITVVLSDAFGETVTAGATIAMSNPSPIFAPAGLVLSSSSIVEGNSLDVSGRIISPNGNDVNTIALNWGDGSAPTTIILDPGDLTFSASHPYSSLAAGVQAQTDSIIASLSNSNLTDSVDFAAASVTINKVAPQISAADLGLSATNANEGDPVTLSGRFTDPDLVSSYSVTINWGDGSSPSVLSSLYGEITATSTPGVFTFSAQHVYLYNSLDAAPGATFDTFGIQATVSNGVSNASASTSLVVNELPPAIALRSDLADDQQESSTIYLTAAVTDPDPLATDSVVWSVADLFGNVLASGTGTHIAFPNNGGVVTGIVTATVTSSDGGNSTDAAQVLVIGQSDATIVITPSNVTISVAAGPGTTTLLGNADRLIAQIYGGNDLVDATQVASSLELDGFGGGAPDPWFCPAAWFGQDGRKFRRQ